MDPFFVILIVGAVFIGGLVLLHRFRGESVMFKRRYSGRTPKRSRHRTNYVSPFVPGAVDSGNHHGHSAAADCGSANGGDAGGGCSDGGGSSGS